MVLLFGLEHRHTLGKARASHANGPHCQLVPTSAFLFMYCHPHPTHTLGSKGDQSECSVKSLLPSALRGREGLGTAEGVMGGEMALTNHSIRHPRSSPAQLLEPATFTRCSLDSMEPKPYSWAAALGRPVRPISTSFSSVLPWGPFDSFLGILERPRDG